MKKLLIILAILFATQAYSQTRAEYAEMNKQNRIYPFVGNPTTGMDLTVLLGGTSYWMLAKQPQADKILHFWGGYFATNALQQSMSSVLVSKFMRRLIPPLLVGSACLLKESIDSRPDRGDLNAGFSGILLSVVNFNLTFEIRDYEFRKNRRK